MKLDLNKFYNTNYKDFVHKEAVEEALKRVPELELKDVEVENILSLTFSVDQHGENPMYVEYLDKEGKKHIVRICPAVTEEINEILKNYETKEEHQADVENIYNYFNTLNVPMEVRSQNSLNEEGNKDIILNNDNAFISFQVDPEQDNAIQWLAIQNKNGALGDQYQYMARFVDFAKVDEVPNNADFAEKLQELEEKMTTADNNVLATSKEYTDSNISSLANELNVKVEQTKNDLTVLIDEKAGDTLQQAKEYADIKDTEYFETGKRYADNVKQEAVDESKNYTNTKHDEALTIIEPCQQKLSNIWQSHKATFIYWLPNIDINTMKLENKENDVKVTLNDGDVVYWRKNEYQPVDLSNYYTKPESDEKYASKEELLRQVTGLVEADADNYSNLHGKINQKTEVYTRKEGQSTETRYQRVTFNKLTNGDVSFSPGKSSDPIYGYLLNETQLTKLKNLDDNPTGNSIDVKVDNSITPTKINYRRDTNAVEVFNGDTRLLNGAFITPEQSNNITSNTTKLTEVPNGGRVPNICWYPDGKSNYWRLVNDGEYVRTHINNHNDNDAEAITYLPKFKSAKESEVSALKTLVSSMGETNPIEMSVKYNDNSLELNNYSTYTTIGNTTIVNINCNFTAPFVSGTSPIWNWLYINSETLKSFPSFMIDCIMKTDTTISSYTTTTVFSNNDTMILVETPVIASDETIRTSLISFNGTFVFQQ